MGKEELATTSFYHWVARVWLTEKATDVVCVKLEDALSVAADATTLGHHATVFERKIEKIPSLPIGGGKW